MPAGGNGGVNPNGDQPCCEGPTEPCRWLETADLPIGGLSSEEMSWVGASDACRVWEGALAQRLRHFQDVCLTLLDVAEGPICTKDIGIPR